MQEQLTFVRSVSASPRDRLYVEADRFVVRFQGGDREAFDDLYEQNYDVLYGYARTLLRNHQLAEDITQQVFLAVLKAAPGFAMRPGRRFRSWLMCCAHNAVIDATRRRAKFSPDEPESLAWRLEERVRESTAPAHWRHDHGFLALVDQLPEGQRNLLILRFGLDLSFDEVADILGVTERTVRRRESHALDVLRLSVGAGSINEPFSNPAPSSAATKSGVVARRLAHARSRGGRSRPLRVAPARPSAR